MGSPLQSRPRRAGTDRAGERRAVRDHRRDAGGLPRPRGQRPRLLGTPVAAGAVPAGTCRQRGPGRRRGGGAAQARRVDGERPRAVVGVGFEPADPHRRSPRRAHHPAAETRHAPAADGGHRGLRATLHRVRTDPGDWLRQRRQPAARSCGGPSARDRHPAVARGAAPPHHPPTDDRELAAGTGRGRRWLLHLAGRARGHGLLGDADDAGRYRRRQSQRARRRLAGRAVPDRRGHGGHRILRADARAPGHADRAGAHAARRTGEETRVPAAPATR